VNWMYLATVDILTEAFIMAIERDNLDKNKQQAVLTVDEKLIEMN